MKSEDKELLVRDLSARLPYGVICQYNCVIPCGRRLIEKINARDVLKGIIPMSDDHIGFMVGIDKVNALEGDIKPYLRSMSSMTEEEFQELHSICPNTVFNKTNVSDWIIGIDGSEYGRISRIDEISKLIDWLNEHHFDYRGLIEKGLALEATKGIYEKGE